jgi:hypothetical protein
VGDHRPSSRRSSYCTAEAAAIVTAVITANGDSQPLELTQARTIWAKECWAKEFTLLSVPIPLPPIPLPIPGPSWRCRKTKAGRSDPRRAATGTVLCSQAVSLQGRVRRGRSRTWRAGPTTPAIKNALANKSDRNSRRGEIEPARPMDRSKAQASGDEPPKSPGCRQETLI